MENIIIKDKNGRILLESKGSRFIISRFVDMDNATKDKIAELYFDLTGKSKEDAIKFLNFESDIGSFCS